MEKLTQTWMSQLDDNKLLSEITIPGTHDSGTYTLGDGPIDSAAKCQTQSIAEQLNNGIRFLDIRLARGTDNDGVLWLYHGGSRAISVALDLTFEQVINDCIHFLDKNPQETIVMSVKKEFGDEIHDWVKSTIEKRTDWNQRWWLSNNKNPALKQIRGKIVLFRRFDMADFGLDTQGGWPVDSEGPLSHHNINFYVQDVYSSWSDDDDRKEKFNVHVKNCLIKASEDNKNTIYINFASATGFLGGLLPLTTNPRDMADTVLPLFHQYLSETTPARYGIIPMDFPEIGSNLTKLLINCNKANVRAPVSGSVVEICTTLGLFKDGYDFCMDVKGGDSQDGAPVIVYEAKRSNNQKWKLTDAGDGFYYLEPQHATGKVLDADYRSGNETKVAIRSRNGSDSQKWKITTTSDYPVQYTISPKSTQGSCLDIKGGICKNGSEIILFPKHGGDNQLWYINKIG
ncbi:phosphatidylinositol-specific phospholipase C domain-containing protein [Sphingobacterium spiritivorum]|uniref:phosphatidylinositol-specific phospholipase C domain-containing protein n=1 Tax=Sphingobacterium spiritivorum TaxID=258 RepID=UPI001918F30F|nr:phosphatidylinositol-specific phospholipase C domain-containing protein [Sphingobacterium spiritivorum]QQT26686.1 phosphatidylinositol-specific phospholipase C domain-containing protein [Sphingobacterium spiritivorum]